jgi:phosphatidate phosphatase APP1
MGMVRRFTRKGAANARVTLTLGPQSFTTDTDAKGYFRFQGQLPTSRPTQQPTQDPTSVPSACNRPFWGSDHTAPIPATAGILPFSLIVETNENGNGKRYKAPPYHGFLVYRSANRGIHVITDLDDTLIWTYVTQKTKLAKQALFDDVRKVKAIDGAISFLETLLCKPSNQGGGTLHYLSGSPTRLFDRILRIFRLHRFPLGSLTLRPLSNTKAASQSQQSLYKIVEIRRILRTYPQEQFVLVGDNGEKDPVIYNTIRNESPKQIRAILIHQVKPLTLEQQALSNTFYFKDYKDATRYIHQHLRN